MDLPCHLRRVIYAQAAKLFLCEHISRHLAIRSTAFQAGGHLKLSLWINSTKMLQITKFNEAAIYFLDADMSVVTHNFGHILVDLLYTGHEVAVVLSYRAFPTEMMSDKVGYVQEYGMSHELRPPPGSIWEKLQRL